MSSSEAFKMFAGGAVCIMPACGGVRAVSVESIADVGAEMGAKLICKLSDSWRSSKSSRTRGSRYWVKGILNCRMGGGEPEGLTTAREERNINTGGWWETRRDAGLWAENILDCVSYGRRRIPPSSKCQSPAHGRRRSLWRTSCFHTPTECQLFSKLAKRVWSYLSGALRGRVTTMF